MWRGCGWGGVRWGRGEFSFFLFFFSGLLFCSLAERGGWRVPLPSWCGLEWIWDRYADCEGPRDAAVLMRVGAASVEGVEVVAMVSSASFAFLLFYVVSTMGADRYTGGGGCGGGGCGGGGCGG